VKQSYAHSPKRSSPQCHADHEKRVNDSPVIVELAAEILVEREGVR
jgi:hypothetical protein